MVSEIKSGPMCECGHGMYGHYMCGAPSEMPCYTCKCPQFKPANGAGKSYDPRKPRKTSGVMLDAVPRAGD